MFTTPGVVKLPFCRKSCGKLGFQLKNGIKKNKMLGFKLPKDDAKYQWTNHVKDKMMYYRISESLVKRVIRFPKRTEVGIAPGTIAVMQPAGNKRKPQEIWVMYVIINQKSKFKNQNDNTKVKKLGILENSKKRIISCWRYPGVSPVGQPIPIPDEILQELDALLD